MPADHLVGDSRRHRIEIEVAVFLGHARMEGDLKQQIAKFLAQRRHIAVLDRVGNLVGFLDRVGGNGGESLLDIPGTSVLGVSELDHDLQQTVKISGHFRSSSFRHLRDRGSPGQLTGQSGDGNANFASTSTGKEYI